MGFWQQAGGVSAVLDWFSCRFSISKADETSSICENEDLGSLKTTSLLQGGAPLVIKWSVMGPL